LDEQKALAEAAIEHLVMVYATPSAAQALSGKSASMPVGSILAKEKHSGVFASPPEGVAFMLKHSDDAFRNTGDWEFRYYPPSGDPVATHQHCAACHRLGQSRDYVLGSYPSQ
jgi:hypothetical protein